MRKKTLKENSIRDPYFASEKTGLVYLLDDCSLIISAEIVEEMTALYEKGHPIETIAEEFNFDPDEVFIVLFHQARKGNTSKPFAYRQKKQLKTDLLNQDEIETI